MCTDAIYKAKSKLNAVEVNAVNGFKASVHNLKKVNTHYFVIQPPTSLKMYYTVRGCNCMGLH